MHGSGVGLLLLCVAYLDYITGNEIRIFPLYFLPLTWAAIVYGMKGAVLLSCIASIMWIMVQYLSGHIYSSFYIWGINFITQGAAFITVTGLVAFLREKLINERALSRSDMLTGLLNRRAFYEMTGAELALCHRNNRSATMAFIDLDNFKQVNDTHGHSEGDALLIQVAKILKESMRASDIIARLGGDEFAIFLPETHAEQAQTVLESLARNLQKAPSFEFPKVSASIGAVAYAKAPAHVQDILKEADIQMYSVKALGKNSVNIKHM